MKLSRRAPAILSVASLAASLLTGCGPKTGSQITYETAPVQTGDLVQTVTATGTLNAVVTVDVGSQISGRIAALNADFNSPVQKGRIIAEIDTSTYQAAVDQAKGELASAEATRDLAQITLRRQRDLVARHAAAQVDLDKADAEARQAEAQVTVKKALLDKANADLGHCRIAAPVDGIVVTRKVDVGQTVAAAMTTPILFTIAQDIRKMHIIANVSEADIGQIKAGQNAGFTVDAFPDDTFQGRVSQVRLSGTTSENVVTYDTVIDVDNPEGKLFPSMTAEIAVRIAERRAVPTLPNAALRFSPPTGASYENPAAAPGRGQRIVYLPGASPGSLKTALIRTGITDGARTEILEGLQAGDRVITASSEAKTSRGFGGGPPPPQ